jgi:hypothetical protein
MSRMTAAARAVIETNVRRIVADVRMLPRKAEWPQWSRPAMVVSIYPGPISYRNLICKIVSKLLHFIHVSKRAHTRNV